MAPSSISWVLYWNSSFREFGGSPHVEKSPCGRVNVVIQLYSYTPLHPKLTWWLTRILSLYLVTSWAGIWTPKDIPWTPSQEVFGCLGYIPEQKNGLFQTTSLRHSIFFSLLSGLTYLGRTKTQRIPEWNAEVDLFDSPFEGNFSDLQALRMAILGTWSLGFSFFSKDLFIFLLQQNATTACSLVFSGRSCFCWGKPERPSVFSPIFWKLLEGQMPIHL